MGVTQAGAELPLADRTALALDGISYALKNYRIDPNRVYVSGWREGAAVSSLLAAAFPQHIDGAMVAGEFTPRQN